MINLQDLHQGSAEWLALRKSKVCASEAAIILGISPWKTKFQLWEEKTGRKDSGFNSAAMQYGTDMEPKIREWFENKEQTWFIPEVVISSKHDWMLASLDGISADREIILEIKTCNAKVFAEAKDLRAPDYYIAQAQHQLACVDSANLVHFVFFHKGEYAEVKVFRDEEYIEKMIFAESKFYQDCMLGDKPPEKTEREIKRDEAKVIDEPEAVLIADELENTIKEMDVLAKKEKELRARLYELAGDDDCYVGQLKLTRLNGRSVVDYKKACVDHGIETEKYERQGNPFWKISITK